MDGDVPNFRRVDDRARVLVTVFAFTIEVPRTRRTMMRARFVQPDALHLIR